MDNEYYPPHEQHQGEPAPTPALEGAPPPDANAVIEQVRELLFGDHRRATEGSLKGLEDRVAALTATIEARFADLERRLTESKTEADQSRDGRVEAIGAVFAELGDKIKSLIAPPAHS